MIRVDFQPPETPVSQVNVPSGIDAVTFFRLFPVAPLMTRLREPLVTGRRFGMAISRVPFK